MVVENKDATFGAVWDEAARAVRRANTPTYSNRHNTGPRYWHVMLQGDFALHPVVERIVNTHGIRPVNWQQLLLEWPHVSTDDAMKLAYTRDEKAGADYAVSGSTRQTKTSIGKYLARHWPHVPDHTRRDWAALHTPDKMEIVSGIEDIICVVEQGPQSCMKSSYGSIPFDADDNSALMAWLSDPDDEEPDWGRHPYAVYTPNYGWAMAVHRNYEGVVGRALLWTDPGDADLKLFVRSYIRGRTDSDRSETDTALEAWLQGQGYRKRQHWPDGAKFAKIDHPTSGQAFMMPYLDASGVDTRRVTERPGYIVRDSGDGEYCCDCTNGETSFNEREEVIGSCEACGDIIMEADDYHYAGRDEDALVCDSCIDRRYTLVRADAGSHSRPRCGYREYYIPDGDAGAVVNRGYSVDPDHLPEDVVALEEGDHAELDDCVVIEDEWYLIDDDRVLRVEEEHPDTGSSYALKDDCWQDCDGDWHRDDIECVELDGYKYTREKADALIAEGQENLDFSNESEGETA